MNIYGFDDYNQQGSLRVSGWMWFWFIYSLRHAILWLGLSIAHSPGMLDEFTNETHWAYLLCGIPSLVLLSNIGFRIPNSGVIPRWIWKNGRWLLASSILLHVVIAIGFGLIKPEWHISVEQILFFTLDALGLRFIFKSQRVKDVFADFPARPEKVEKKHVKPAQASRAEGDSQVTDKTAKLISEEMQVPALSSSVPDVLKVGVGEALQFGIRSHQSGQLALAEQVYMQILAHYPENADALHLMGVVNHQRGIRDEAERLILKAITVQPNAAVYYGNLGRVYHAQGRMVEAIARYEQALQIQPDFPDAIAGLESLRGRAWLQAKN